MKPKQLSDTARSFSGSLCAKDRFLATYRPYLCPFHVLMEHVPQDCSVLDVGCGGGLWLLLLSRSGRISSGVGFDVRADKTESANSIKNEDDNLEFIQLGIDDNWPNGSFDCLTMIDVLHHVPLEQHNDFLGRIEQARAKRIVFKDIDPASGFKSFMNTVHDVVLSHQVPKYSKRAGVVECFEGMGYAIVENLRCDMLWYSHYLIVAEKE